MFLSRMPTLLEQLGPIKATSFHVARRSANSLHAGYAVYYLRVKMRGLSKRNSSVRAVLSGMKGAISAALLATNKFQPTDASWRLTASIARR